MRYCSKKPHALPRRRRRLHPDYLYVFGYGPAGSAAAGSLLSLSVERCTGLQSRSARVRQPLERQHIRAPGHLSPLSLSGCCARARAWRPNWSWNLETLSAGIAHRVVRGTVHLIRRKSTGSLDRQNAAGQLLPYLPPDLAWAARTAPFSSDEVASRRALHDRACAGNPPPRADRQGPASAGRTRFAPPDSRRCCELRPRAPAGRAADKNP